MLKAGTAARRRTLTWPNPHMPEAVQAQVINLLRGIDTRLQPHNAQWIGHVKILISSAESSMYGSITMANDQPRWSGTLSQALHNAELTVYAAIYGLTDAEVAAAVDGVLSLEGSWSHDQHSHEQS